MNRERFLKLVRLGVPISWAAVKCGVTPGTLRGLRKSDPAFDRECTDSAKLAVMEFVWHCRALTRSRLPKTQIP